MFSLVMNIVSALFSPEFRKVLGELQDARRRELTREIEAAKAAAQGSGDTRPLQKELGKLTE